MKFPINKQGVWIMFVCASVAFLNVICLSSEILLRNTVIGIISGIISYLVSQSEIKKIVRNDSSYISNQSFPGLIVLLVGSTVSGFLVVGTGRAILSFGLTLLFGFLILGVVTMTHTPTHDLTTKR